MKTVFDTPDIKVDVTEKYQFNKVKYLADGTVVVELKLKPVEVLLSA